MMYVKYCSDFDLYYGAIFILNNLFEITYMLNILRIKDVINKTGMSRSTIYAMVKKGEFPQQRRIGKNSVGWLDSDVDNWIRDIFINQSDG